MAVNQGFGASAMDALTAAMKSNIVPDQEYLLQGSILDSHLENLQHRLRGLCDGGQEMIFAEREMVFSLRSTPQTLTQALQLRVRRPLTDESGEDAVPWQLRYLGQIQDVSRGPTLVRTCYDIACSNNAIEFLNELGCRLDFEFVAKGFMYRKGRMKITISKIHRILSPNAENSEPLTSSHLVELSVLAPSGNDAVAEDMKSFAEQLKPLVILDKIIARK